MEGALFQKNYSKRGEFQIVKKMTYLFLQFENVYHSPHQEALF